LEKNEKFVFGSMPPCPQGAGFPLTITMNLNIYAGPIVEIKPGGPLNASHAMREFAYETLGEALWVPECHGDPLYFLPNRHSIGERSQTWSEHDGETPHVINPDIEYDKGWFANKIKDLTSQFPDGTEYEIIWGVVSYWM
jgi:hypothetical protein